MDRELEVLDVMTANRDKRVWALAQGTDLKVDDSNTPPFIDVPTNMPGTGPNGTWEYPDPEEAIKHMKVAPGMKVELVASEKDFSELIGPVQMAFDTKGRLFVCTWPSYPHWKPKTEMHDKVVIVSDIGTNGKAGKFEVFADHLSSPTGLEFYNNGLLVGQAPYMKYFSRTPPAATKPNVEDGASAGRNRLWLTRITRKTHSCSIRAARSIIRREHSFTARSKASGARCRRKSERAVWRFEHALGKNRTLSGLQFCQSARPYFRLLGHGCHLRRHRRCALLRPDRNGESLFPQQAFQAADDL